MRLKERECISSFPCFERLKTFFLYTHSSSLPTFHLRSAACYNLRTTSHIAYCCPYYRLRPTLCLRCADYMYVSPFFGVPQPGGSKQSNNSSTTAGRALDPHTFSTLEMYPTDNRLWKSCARYIDPAPCMGLFCRPQDITAPANPRCRAHPAGKDW